MSPEDQKLKIIDAVQKFASFSILLYILGFVTTNAHLSRWGVYSFELLNVQYLAAGLITTIAFGIFGFQVGRRLFFLSEDSDRFAALGRHYRWARTWSTFCSIFVFVELCFAGVIATFWTSSILFRDLFRDPMVLRLLVILTVAFLLDYSILWRTGLYTKKPYVALPLAFAAFLAVIGASWSTIREPRIFPLFLLYAAWAFVLCIVLDIGARRSKGTTFLWFWASISLLGATSAFGSVVYAEVNRSLGGGEPSQVKLIVTNGTPGGLKSLLGVSGDTTGPVMLLAETSSELLIKPDAMGKEQGQALRIRREFIAGIIPTKAKDQPDSAGPHGKPTDQGDAHKKPIP